MKLSPLLILAALAAGCQSSQQRADNAHAVVSMDSAALVKSISDARTAVTIGDTKKAVVLLDAASTEAAAVTVHCDDAIKAGQKAAVDAERAKWSNQLIAPKGWRYITLAVVFIGLFIGGLVLLGALSGNWAPLYNLFGFIWEGIKRVFSGAVAISKSLTTGKGIVPHPLVVAAKEAGLQPIAAQSAAANPLYERADQ
jgi:hypothetical protein